MNKRSLSILAISFLIIMIIILAAVNPGDQSQSCMEYYAGLESPPPEALAWCEAGEYFQWESTLPINADFDALNIFHTCQGNPEDLAILMIHGYPTSSFDYAPLFAELSDEYYVCALDTPGYGFSDKPLDRYDYSIFDDAQLVDYYIREVAELDDFILLSHDKGDSVGLALLQIFQAYEEKPYQIKHHFITNGNIYLPLADLTRGQKALLNPTLGPIITRLLSPQRLAESIAETTFATSLPQSEIDSYASIFDYRNGTAVQHEIIEYLNERSDNEVAWLETLNRSDIPTTLIWGELDAIAPTAVPDHVWENYLADRETPASYWRIPCANHYLQVDESMIITEILKTTNDGNLSSFEIKGEQCEAVRIH